MKATHSIIVGAFLMGGVVLFGVGLFMIGSEKNLFSHTFKVSTYFSKMNGITKGAQVYVSGCGPVWIHPGISFVEAWSKMAADGEL